MRITNIHDVWHNGDIYIYICIHIYISNGLCLSTLPQRVVQTQVICTTMVSWIIPNVRQSKTDLIHRQVMRPLRHGGSHFCKWHLQNGCLHDVRDASLVCELSQFLTAWRLVLSMKPWSYIWLEFGLFFQQLYIYMHQLWLSTPCSTVVAVKMSATWAA